MLALALAATLAIALAAAGAAQQPEYAFAQTPDNTLPTFVPSELTGVGNLDDFTPDDLLLGASVDITTFNHTSGGTTTTYAVVASSDDDGIQIVSLADPANPTGVGYLGDDDTLLLGGASEIATFEHTSGGATTTYAAVASSADSGVQIVSLADPADPTAAGNLADTEGSNGLLLDGAYGITTFVSGGTTYAAVTSSFDHGVQIVSLADPANPTAAGNLADTEGSDELLLSSSTGITTFVSGGTTYAAVASYDDDGVQIVSLTDSSGAILANPTAAGNLADTGGSNGLLLDGAVGITTFVSGGTTYAAVAAQDDDGVQIVSLTNSSGAILANPTAAGKLADTEGSDELLLDGASGITTFVSGGTTYAAVASFYDDGVQIVSLTDSSGAILANPTAAGKLADTEGSNGLLLDGAYGITTFVSGGTTYAAVASFYDDGVQIVSLTDSSGAILTNPTAAGNLADTDILKLHAARAITTFVSGGTTYAAVASYDDDGVQIVSLTDSSGAILANPTAAGNLAGTEDSNGLLLDGANDITTFNHTSGGTTTTYAAVASFDDDGVQIVSLADPANLTAAGHLDNSNIRELNGASSITTFVSGGTTYAAVASFYDDGVQIVSLADPADPTTAGKITDTEGSNGLLLEGANDITTFVSGGTTYAAVASFYDDGVQIVSLTNSSGAILANPAAAGKLADTEGSDELLLDGASGITTFVSGGTTYAAVASFYDDGVQIVSLTDSSGAILANPTAAGKLADTEGSDELLLDDARRITTFVSGGTTYAAVAAQVDDGVQIVSLTDSSGAILTNPTAAGKLADGGNLLLGGAADITTFESGETTYAAVASEYDHGVQLVRLTEPDTPPLTVEAFATTWKTTSADESITLPLVGTGMTVNWGDGSTTAASGSVSHTYATAGDYTIQVTGGLTGFRLGGAADASKLVSIDQWGTASWDTMKNAFWGASNMAYNAADSPDLSSVTDMSSMFRRASSFDGTISGWVVSSVTDMSHMFDDASSFNQPLSGWDVSSVTDMSGMFDDASDFDQPLSGWDVSSVTDMSGMFDDASSFNGIISGWVVSSVTDMSGMFRDASDFDQPLSGWDVSKVTDMNSMFRASSPSSSPTSFNGDISGWDVSSVTDMSYMFYGASDFDQSLSGWVVSSVISMAEMFAFAPSFNGDPSGWDVSSVANMADMFFGAHSFDQNLGNWYVVPADTTYATSEGTLKATTISTQNTALDDPSLLYGIGSGDNNSTLFNITDSKTLMFKSDPSAGTYNANVTASGTNVFEDGNNWRMLDMTVTGQANADPVLGSIGAKSVNELAALSFTATATDGDNDALEFMLAGTIPAGASITSGGAFSWTPSESQDGTHTITIQVQDGNGGSDSETITVTVSEVNEDPVLNPIGPKSVNQLEALTFTATATDGDVIGGTADTLEFSLGAGAPTGASINQNTGAFSWTPTASQVGMHTITFQVEDGAGATDSEAVTVTVSESNENPVLGSIGAKSVNELATLSFTATATDGDNDALEFTLAGTIPAGASITSGGAFSWTPSESQDGTHSVTARVSDGNGGSDSETITVTVSEVNQAPALNPIGPKSVNRPGTLAFTATASDGDVIGGTADSLEFSLAGTIPAGASITSGGAFSWTPTASQIGTHTITIQVEDSSGAADSGAVTVRVTADSVDPPTTRSGGGGSSKQAHALALDLGTVRSTGLASTPQEIVRYLGTFDPDEPIQPAGDASRSDPPLAINGSAYLLGGTHNTLEPQALRPGEPTDITFTVYSTADIVRFAVNMSRQGADAGPQANYTLIRFSDGAVSTVDPGGLIADADVAITRVSGAAYKYRVQADVEFADVTGLTDMVITSENARGASTTVHVASAFEVLPPAAAQAEPDAPEPDMPAPEPDMPAPEPDAPSYHGPPASPTVAFRMWAGFGPATIGDAGLAAALGLDYPDAEIPPWVKTGLVPLVVNGYATVDEFATALEYVLGAIQDRGARDTAGSRPADAGPDAAAPAVASIERSDPAEGSTSETTLVFGATFGKDVIGVDAGDFTLSPDSTGAGSVANLTGSGSRYLVTVSATRDGTYNLDVVRDSGIADAAGNPLSGTDPTGADHTYTVIADTTAPTVASIERSDPAEGSTSEATLVFGVTFGEDVTGVDAGDFALSPDSGGGPGQFTHARTPGLAIPDNAAAVSDAITVPGFGAATSVSVSVDIAHPFIGDLTVELVAPDGTARTLHDRSGGNADGIEQTYTPDFGGTGIAGDWTLRASDGASGDAGTLNGWTLTVGHDGAGGSVTGLAGSGSQYFVTVSAPQGGTYNLDVVQDSGITDAAGNPLADAAPTGMDHTYTVVADTAPPAVASIERSDPAGESTPETTLVFGVTFGEDVTGVDAGGFELSPGSGSGPGQFTHARTPGLAIPDNAAAVSDMITVPGFGTATSVTVSVDIAHPFIGDLMVELVAPDGTAKTLHRYSGEGADGIIRTYTPDFGGTGIAGDWTLRASDGASGDAGTLNGWTLTIGHDGAGGSVTGLAGSGSQYFVTVSAPQGGTYNLDVVQDSGITDAAGNPLADAAPTGADHTYTVIADTTAPTVASIERSDPAEESTSETTLVFGVTFGEDVTGVDAGDFALSPDSGSGPGQFMHARTPGLAIPDNAAAVSDAITVPGFGTATSVTVSVDIAHPYIDDLTVELVAPDGTAKTLHDSSGGNADGIGQTYTPDFGGTGIAGDWTLRVSDGASGDAGTLNGWTLTVSHDGAGGSVTGLAGSGSQYFVTVSAPQGGTYNLDVVQDSGITDAAGNPLADAAPTGADHTYTVIADTTAPTVASIERSDPAEESTSETTLVFGVTFGEDVTGVDAGDFALSPDSGSGPGQFTHARTPGLAIPDNAAAVSDAITVPGFGTATSVTVSVDIAHPYIDDLTVELVAPDGTAKTLHDSSGGNADGIGQTYTPDFGGTGIAGDWALRVSDGASGDAGTLNGWTLTVSHDGAGGSVTGLAGSGSRYLVTVSAPQGGTYNLDVVRDSGIMDAAGSPLADTDPTGPDHTYTVIADTTAPTVASIERSDPAEGSTSETTLVFGVTFSEGVTGVDADDFALSPDSGSGPGQFTHARTPGLAIPDNAAAVSDAITVPGFGAATSVSVSVDIAHPYIDDLTVELVAPDGTAKTLHRYSGEGADDIIRTYTPDFGGTGIAGDWALRVSDGASGDAGTLNGWTLTVAHDGAGGSVTGLTGSGSRYLVTVSAPQEGTYNLDVVRDSGITDAAGNPLADTAPTGPDHTYARTDP